MGVDAAEDKISGERKRPDEGAHRRARILRREMTEARENGSGKCCDYGKPKGTDFSRQVNRSAEGSLPTLSATRARAGSSRSMAAQHRSFHRRRRAATRFLQSEGYRVLRFVEQRGSWRTLEGVHSVISRNLHRRSPRPNPPPFEGEGRKVKAFG